MNDDPTWQLSPVWFLFQMSWLLWYVVSFWSEIERRKQRKEESERDSYREPPDGQETHEPVCCICVWFVNSQWVRSWSTWQPCTEEYGCCHDHTPTHTQPYAPIVIPMSSDNIHFPLLSANAINTNPMWRGPGQEGGSLQSGHWHTEKHKHSHTHMHVYTHTHTHPVASLCSSIPLLLNPCRLDWGNVN